MPEPIFTNCGFFLKLKTLTILQKNILKDCIKGNGGKITFAINNECTHVVTDDANALSSSHLKTIQKKQLPVVGIDFISDSVKENRLLPPFNYDPFRTSESITDVKIISVCEDDSCKVETYSKDGTTYETKSKDSSNTDELRWFSNNDKNIPYFPEDFEIAKYDILEKVTVHGEYVVVELQCALQHCDYSFRICASYSVLDGIKDRKQHAATKTSEEARTAYELCIEHMKKAQFELRKGFPRKAEHLASTKLQEMLVVEAIGCSSLSEEVGVFVELIWAEALGLLDHLLLTPVTSISLNDVSKAEGILLQAKKSLDEGKSPRELTTIIAEFYKIIPHKNGLDCNVCKKLLSNKQDLCQLIRDMLNVHETNMSSPNPSSLSKYRALGCKIDALDAKSEEFNIVKQQVIQNNFSECPIEVLQIYNVGRRTETATFEHTLGNIQSLFHSSSPCNFVGILSRGLLLPKMVVEEHGIKRTDSGNLGSGIYFSNSISTSIKYSQPNEIDGTRLLVICDVALGSCLDTYQVDTSLTTAPSGYDSVHGVRKTEDSNSAFQDDEFVVYRTSQIKMKYVVKFCLATDKVKEYHPTIQAEQKDKAPVSEHQSQPEDYNIPSKDMVNDKAAGLLDRSGNPVPLKEVHIKGRIIDFVGQVVVFQTYENISDSPIEAKYVFPLDDTASVCGFEAFIKGKHIIGEVKEKEKAHQEYREAISQGDGAYLMDQDAPGIFTVSVGNLPPSTKVLIKITYITELNYEDGTLSFHLPTAVAPWQQDKALNENTQDKVTKLSVKQIGIKPGGFSLEMSVEMPFKINDIISWTHQLKIKKTDCKAVICTMENSSLDISGFVIEIRIGNEHLPRMWVEKHPDKKTEACMLVFQPEFAVPSAPSNSCGEIIICLDCSSSMAGLEIHQAKQIALCALDLCHFVPRLSVIKFGTNFVQFPFNPERTDFTALKEFVLSATPSMGNSDLWKTFHYQNLLYPSKGKRSILLISDGHFQNEGMTLQIVKQNAQHTRVFTCGVGSTANRHMLRSLSQYGAGAFEYFDMKSKYNWERKIQCQITRMSSPGCSSVSIKWQQFDTNAPELTYAPAQIQSLFNDERLLVYGFISHCTQATLNALIDDQEFQTMVSTTELQKTTGTMLHKLAARAFIRDYEHGILHENEAEHEMKKQQLKSLIIKLSLDNSIVTQFTSFVAIERRDMNEDEGADTLNISELVAKEDVDILPYMQYQPAYMISWGSPSKSSSEQCCSEDETQASFLAQKHSQVSADEEVSDASSCVDIPFEPEKQMSEAGWQLGLQKQSLDSCSLPAAPVPEMASSFSSSLLSGQQFSSPTPIIGGFGSTFSGAVSAGSSFPVQGINWRAGHPLPLQDQSLSLSNQQFSLTSAATGVYGSPQTYTFGRDPKICEQEIVVQRSPPMPLQKDQKPLFSNEQFSFPLDTTHSSGPPSPGAGSSFTSSCQQFSSPSPLIGGFGSTFSGAVSTGSSFPVQGINLGGGHPIPLQDQSLSLSNQQFSLPSEGIGCYSPARTYTFGSAPEICKQTVMQSSPPMPLQKDQKPLFSSEQVSFPLDTTHSSGPSSAKLVCNRDVGRINMKGQPMQYQPLLLPGQQLQSSPSAIGLFSFHSPSSADQPMVQCSTGLRVSTAADMPLSEDQRSDPSPAISVGNKLALPFCRVHSLGKIGARLGSSFLKEGRSQKIPQDLTVHKKKSFKKLQRMLPLSAVSWPQLFKLQNQDGYWQLTPELGTLLDLDVDYLVNVSLTKMGIQSLGSKGKEKLLQLIATLLVLQVIRFKQLEGITFKSLMKLNDCPPSWAFDAVKKAAEWAQRTHRQFPAICQRLELGKDWDSATEKLLRIEIIVTSTSPANSK